MPSDKPIFDPFVSGSPIARWLIASFWLMIVLLLISALSAYWQITLLWDVRAGRAVTDAALEANDRRQQTIGGAYVLVLLITAGLFLRWLYRVYANLPALSGHRLLHSPGWAIGSFFVPVLNLFRPFQIVRETWNASDPDLATGATTRTKAPPLVAWWWGCFLISGVLARASMSFSSPDNPTLSSLLLGSWVSLASDLFDVIPAILAIRVVQGIDARQEARRRFLPPHAEANASV